MRKSPQVTNRAEEWRALRAGLLNCVGPEMSAGADRDRADLWMYLIGEEANHALARGDLDDAELAYEHVLDYLVSLNEPAVEPNIAGVNHQLGRIAEERQQFDLAEQWCKKALEIYERLGHPPLMVNSLAQLGVLRSKQGRLPESVL
ncbi:MAG TPA: tetratricopeptide repeat protein [Blastocatellia bacterium]|nr:tetratricopeptide repeat protein [Blastocatellia bacterium]